MLQVTLCGRTITLGQSTPAELVAVGFVIPAQRIVHNNKPPRTLSCDVYTADGQHVAWLGLVAPPGRVGPRRLMKLPIIHVFVTTQMVGGMMANGQNLAAVTPADLPLLGLGQPQQVGEVTRLAVQGAVLVLRWQMGQVASMEAMMLQPPMPPRNQTLRWGMVGAASFVMVLGLFVWRTDAGSELLVSMSMVAVLASWLVAAVFGFPLERMRGAPWYKKLLYLLLTVVLYFIWLMAMTMVAMALVGEL